MDRKELETYQVQLSQVELALVSDPSNEELTSLRSQLKELISLTETALEQAEAATAASASTAASSSKSKSHDKTVAVSSVTFSAGDEALAKYSGDGKWYPARITSIGGAEDRRVYSVVFKGYNSTELVAAADVKPLPASYAAADNAGPSTKKRKLTEEEEKEAARKKVKNEKRVEVRAQKAAEQNGKQAAWQKFAKKGEKKGVVIAGLQGKSIFQSPDNAHGRVGVTGSGKGMSDGVQRIKHKFTPTS
ncbi:hypothetical protein FRB94_003459 [Tulasnella sp. JGI-2019a]|nr:hypothetical protein FRB93_000543 [Tulasnella sp. JGI-2019a]KAG9002932.1 hypothetical protein FRB94_003459 [Tulasnella sp. JGI-2019a]KAG9033900.1 hypothetical protein FRB95_014103 [Tulasnella sp. JGI-2019a]